jgi:hypothetical protein
LDRRRFRNGKEEIELTGLLRFTRAIGHELVGLA